MDRRHHRRRKNILSHLDYYFTFIHYFGFSINPNDITVFETSKLVHKTIDGDEIMNGHTSNNSATVINRWLRSVRKIKQILRVTAARRLIGSSCFSFGLMKLMLLKLVKFIAISFTSILTLNHCIVLIDYIFFSTTTSLSFLELMLEVRLVVTKFSALIFVLSWHFMQGKVRRLIRLVKSTNLYILSNTLCIMSEEDEGMKQDGMAFRFPPKFQEPAIIKHWQQTKTTAAPVRFSLKWHQETFRSKSSGEEVEDCDADVDKKDRRILKWWTMCVIITGLHFSLSEAELTSSQHLWQWLDDYSLHQLNNQTVSEKTLFFLVSLDNYAYTVHVYGTRLIGASIICIVCSLQAESIGLLRGYALQLLQVSRKDPSYLLECTTNRGLFFVLGESSWVSVERAAKASTSLGYLSSSFSWARQLIQVRSMGFVLASSTQVARRAFSQFLRKMLAFFSGSKVSFLATEYEPEEEPGKRFRSPTSRIPVGAAQVSRARSCSSSSIDCPITTFTSPLESSKNLLDELNGDLGLLWKNKNREERGEHFRLSAGIDHTWSPPPPLLFPMNPTRFEHGKIRTESKQLINRLEWQLERLASKYELIQTVSAHIDSCFGPMLFIQFSFLFIMSCIDVVYFSICFNPNTKTKYIIVSGMILLWWPYLLLYKFASDIGAQSMELLLAVRRLARLSLLSHYNNLASHQFQQQHKAVATAATFLNESLNHKKTSPFPTTTDRLTDYYNNSKQLTYSSKQLLRNYSSAHLIKRDSHHHLNLPHNCSSLLSSYSNKPTRSHYTGLSARINLTDSSNLILSELNEKQQTARKVAGIISKLDYVFKPTYVSIMGIMTVNKFFLLSFAKIVITASVMIIQFIT